MLDTLSVDVEFVCVYSFVSFGFPTCFVIFCRKFFCINSRLSSIQTHVTLFCFYPFDIYLIEYSGTTFLFDRYLYI